MPGLDLTTIRAAIASSIADGTGREVQGYPYPKGNEQLPCVIVHPGDEYVDWWGSLGDGAVCILNFVLELRARCSVTFEDGLRVLDEMVSVGVGLPSSVFDAIEADRTFGGVADDALLGVSSGHSGINPDVDGRPQAVTCRLPLTVWKQRS